MDDHDTWILNRQDSKVFVDALLNPPEPNEALRNAVARYKRYGVGAMDDNRPVVTIALKGIFFGVALSIPLWGALIYALTSVTWNVIWAALWSALP